MLILEALAYSRMAEVEDEHWWFVARRKIVASLIRGLDLPQWARILEIGCGTGGNLEILSIFASVTAIQTAPETSDYRWTPACWPCHARGAPTAARANEKPRGEDRNGPP